MGTCEKNSICFVMEWHPDCKIGGAEIQAWLLAKALAERGWRVHYVSEYNKLPFQEEVREGVHIHAIRQRGVLKRIQLDVLRYITLYKLLKKINTDVYYQRHRHPYTGMVAHFAKVNNKRFVWACSSSSNCKKKTFIRDLDGYAGYVLKKIILLLVAKFNDELYLYGIKNADRVLVQAEYQQKLFRENFGIESIIIKNGLPVPTKLLPKKNPPVVLWIASIKRLKQAEIFVRLARHCKDFDWRFILAGRASDRGYWAEILKQMQGLSNIEYVGEVTFDEGNDLIGRASVFVNTSAYEGFPNTFIQAWMCGVPVVSLNVDPDDVLSREGIGFKSNTFENLCRDVRALIEDKRLRETMGLRARLYARNNHSIEAVTDNFLSVIQSIL